MGVKFASKDKAIKAKSKSGQKGEKSFGWKLLIPVLAFFGFFNIVPTLWMLGLSFNDYKLISSNAPHYVGLSNYQSFLADQQVAHAVNRTFVFLAFAIIFQTTLGILIGVLFWRNDKLRGRRLALTLLFTPMVVTPVASALFWKLILDPNFGVGNYFLQIFGIAKIDVLTSQSLAFPTLLVVDTWMWTPFMALMTLAALGSVPKAELEAASIDRLPLFTVIKTVVWPHAKFILMLGILLRSIDAFKTMDLSLIMTDGGPGDKTELIALSLYRYAFKSFNLGYSSAISVFLLFIAISLTSIYLYVLNLKSRKEA
ncbi:MAG: sugar ABC transporter permease [Actinobacteria bacterium]|nr:sugar ABC transporter permease [Actinomycetota bacterium]